MSTSVKYQIFISSTYEDLKEQREQVVRAVLEMGHIPVGMEMFSAADDTQWQLIKRYIEVSDYYVVLVAHRYGSMDGTISFTEKEYDYAASLNVPILGFVLKEGAAWPQGMVDKDATKTAGLASFKGKVKNRIVSHWSSTEELHGKVSVALMKQFAATPRDGWVRASTLASPQITSELSRLSQENGELRVLLEKAQTKKTADQERGVTRTIKTLQASRIGVSIWYVDNKDWIAEEPKTLFDLFFLVAPETMVEKSTESTAQFVATMWRQDRKSKLRSTWPIPSNSVKSWLADLAALDLMEPSKRKHSVADKTEYWTLTQTGREIYKIIRKNRLEAGVPTEPGADDD